MALLVAADALRHTNRFGDGTFSNRFGDGTLSVLTMKKGRNPALKHRVFPKLMLGILVLVGKYLHLP